MNLHRFATLTSVLMGIVLGVGSLGSPASAAPNKIGPVTDLTLAASPASGGGYAVTSTWTPLAAATAYKVVLTSGGVVLASVTQTSPPWSATLSLTANSQIQVSVTPLEGKRPGNSASAVYLLPDVTPPTGTFTVTRSGMDATITQVSLQDDVTPSAEIKRSVVWGDGSAAQTWQTGVELTHNYAALGRYVPTVRLTDNAGNAVTLTLKAAVFGDTTAPVAHVAAGPSSAFAKWTQVRLNLESLTDDYTPSDLIERTVSWGDGTTEAWTTGSTLTHVYGIAGTFTPSVVVLDESGNSAKATASPITVVVDAVGPTVSVAKPSAASRIRSWRTVKGTAKDAGVGTASVSVAAIQKRSTGWFAYSSSAKAWVATGTRAKAWKKAVAVTAALDASTWKARLGGLRKGRLMVRAWASDNVANASAVASRSATLTR